jgi:LPXTG-motif cell wall-anchored protein
MKKNNALLVVIMLITLLATNSLTHAQTRREVKKITTQYDTDKNQNYGWIGLLGLIGLLGFVKRKNLLKETPVVQSPNYNS